MLTFARSSTLCKATAIGFLLSEAFILGWTTGKSLTAKIIGITFSQALIPLLVTTGLIISYLLIRSSKRGIRNVMSSGRIDLLIALTSGSVLSLSFEGFALPYYKEAIYNASTQTLLAIISIPPVIALLVIARTVKITIFQKKNELYAPTFIDDTEKKSIQEDLFNLSEQAERFANRLLNGGSDRSLVFAIDAPWGIGKSSFINFCREHWESKHDNLIIYKFNPLRFEGTNSILEKFIDGLITSIQRDAFIPEIRPIISKYSRLIKAKGELSFSGAKLGLLPGAYSAEDAIEDLETELKALGKKIIIIIDDLDRLDFSSIKSVLFAIKKCFTLPNISYVLCYDTENIYKFSQQDLSSEKIIEFLEKFVNVKASLYIDNDLLIEFITQNIRQSLSGNSQTNPILVSKVAEGLKEIFKAENYHEYLPYIGDLRKIKRILNTIILLELEKVDFENIDLNKRDLIHLILIYIYYPNIFRKIYESESHNNHGFFSLVDSHDPRHPSYLNDGDGGNKFDNSTQYSQYISKLSEHEKFLVEQIFTASIRLSDDTDPDLSEEEWTSYACFNGCGFGKRNLDTYFDLILKLTKPEDRTQYKRYANLKNIIINGRQTIEEVLAHNLFSTNENEESHRRLWRVLVNSGAEIPFHIAKNIIFRLIEDMPKHSLYQNQEIEIGLRDDLHFYLVKLLDSSGWQSDNAHRNNRPENIRTISEWIFGESEYTGKGILESLFRSTPSILALYDSLKFRMFCSADRGGDVYNLTRALSLHVDKDAPIEGSVKEISKVQMRKISQVVFRHFKKEFILPEKNIFNLIDQLKFSDFTGSWHEFTKDEINRKGIENTQISNEVKKLKSRLILYITYQLGSTAINRGVCCGIYNESGPQHENGIHKAFNHYLFEICFNPDKSKENYKHFITFLLCSYLGAPSFEDELSNPSISELTKSIDKKDLKTYWEKHRAKILESGFSELKDTIVTSNHSGTFSRDLPKIFNTLDSLLDTDVPNSAEASSSNSY